MCPVRRLGTAGYEKRYIFIFDFNDLLEWPATEGVELSCARLPEKAW